MRPAPISQKIPKSPHNFSRISEKASCNNQQPTTHNRQQGEFFRISPVVGCRLSVVGQTLRTCGREPKLRTISATSAASAASEASESACTVSWVLVKAATRKAPMPAKSAGIFATTFETETTESVPRQAAAKAYTLSA